MKSFLLCMLLLGTSCAFGQSDSLSVTLIEFTGTETAPVLRIDIRAGNPSQIGMVTVDVLSASGSALLYKKEYTRAEITAANLWTSAGLSIGVPGLETGASYEIRTTFQNLQEAFIGQLIDTYPL